jgi:hypothetical protein
VIVELLLTLLALGLLPFVVFLCAKLGTYGYLQAHNLFDREHPISQERKEFNHGESHRKA